MPGRALLPSIAFERWQQRRELVSRTCPECANTYEDEILHCPEDGLDLTAVEPTDEFFEVLPLITGEFETFVRGRGYGDRVLMGLDLDRIVVRADRPLPLQADGEDLGDVEEAVFEARRDAVSVLV